MRLLQSAVCSNGPLLVQFLEEERRLYEAKAATDEDPGEWARLVSCAPTSTC
jgi:hypothetical protein